MVDNDVIDQTIRKEVQLKVLLADDDPVSLKVLKLALQPEGYEICSASNGSEAWAQFEEEDAPAVAVIDWMMPDIDGISLCRRLRHLDRQRRRYTYVLLVTARAQSSDVVDGLQAGADDYLVKPLNLPELRARVLVGRRIVELQSELIERNQMLEDYNAAISHDLKTPLIAVRMTLGQVMEGLYGDLEPPAVQVLGRARESVSDLLAMCETILALAKVARQDQITGAREVDLLSVARDAARDLRPLLDQERKQLEITTDGQSSYMMLGVQSEMKRLFLNLLDNAIKFADSQHPVKVDLHKHESSLRISIENHGAEIPEQARRALFVRFSEIAGGGAKPGTGLGLYLCRRIVERHSGRIWYEHERGVSRFVFEISAV